MPKSVKNIRIVSTHPESIKLPIVFSALPTDIAQNVEKEFAKAGTVVCSNASAYRKDPLVPILIPEINANQAQLIIDQREKYNWSGAIVTNSNCTSTGMTIALKPLLHHFGLQQVIAVSMQAVSGAGYPGVASMDIMGNVIPYIQGEDEKVEWEPLKMLGEYNAGAIKPANFVISAHTNRVAVIDGHIVCLSVKLAQKADLHDVLSALTSYNPPEVCLDLPSTPKPVIEYFKEPDRPQPRLDRYMGRGMTTGIGRLRKDPVLDYKFVVLSHNTIRGAAGGSIYNAELLLKQGFVS